MRVLPGFNTVTPYFFVDGAARFPDFLAQGLGGIEIGRHMNGDRQGGVRDACREPALPPGFVDVKVCALSEIWSGLKPVIRKELR